MSTPDCTTFSTLAIHAGFDPDPITGDVVPPIHVASTFVQDRPGELREGYEYGRCGNPTTNAFAGALAALEGATHGFAFPSGMSAEDTVIRLLARPGDHVVHSTDVYGGTHKLLSVIKPAEGITSEAVDLTDLAEAGHYSFVFRYADADATPDIARMFGVQGLPTVVAIAAGQPIANFAGGQPKEALTQWVAAVKDAVAGQLTGIPAEELAGAADSEAAEPEEPAARTGKTESDDGHCGATLRASESGDPVLWSG